MRWAFVLIWLMNPTWAESIVCEGTNVSVNAPVSTHSDLTCKAVNHARALFEQCGLPPLADPIRIELVRELKPGCVAIYHCGTDWIEVLEPPLMQARRNSESAFYFLLKEDYFQSVVVHELSHVLFDKAPCPFASCPATNEYFAYALQVMSLSPSERIKFAVNSAIEKKVSRDELSFIILLMAPDRFAQKAWAHLSQQDDKCRFLGQVLDGTVLLDYERF